MEGAAGQEHQRGCLQPHSGGARRGTGPLLPADPGRGAQTDQVQTHKGHIHCQFTDIFRQYLTSSSTANTA